ncbi:hypothetical protein Taro_041654 [Colocasia esculenta]|uniref:Leucine-rich repeat-containing N-terminal plant-type domain-containing protein n=1 Tax=Colocasia esculenta TaxID=4460 RepID=A0A843WC10_COLES|nr:hypothetical protein [Colocasia esculenta]
MKKWQTLLPLLLLLVLALSATASAAGCHPDDEAGLLALKSAVTADPTGLLSSWKPGTDCCTWNGVSCREASRVTELSIYGKPGDPTSYLSGTIPPSFSRLRKLVGLYLQDLKNLTGPFPAALLRLPDIKYVYIRNASLSGTIPDLSPLAAKLGALGLAGNRFSGPIPESVGKLTQLSQLELARNRLSGGIPPSVGRLSNLTTLALDHNELSGVVPNLSGLTGLYTLQLSHNQLVGEIPRSLAPLAPQLRFLELGHNRLTGRIPDFLGNFSALDTLDLSGNLLTGTVPATFRYLTKIFNLDLSGNALVDPFPEMAVKGIESLDLSHNRFHLGKIPRWVSTSPIIYSLKLAGCGIKMRMEDFKPAETYFYDYIDLSDNEITGSPAALLNRTQFLVSFRAAGNKLRFDMAGLPLPETLQDLDLSRNMVYGKVPAAVAGLKTLDVSYNRLCGQLPKTQFSASAFAGNACLCGTPLAPCQRRS